jgi:hypothetical protein
VRRHAARVHKAHQPLLSPRRPRARARLSTEEKLMAGNLSQDAAGHSCRGARLAVHAGPSLTLLAYLCSSGHDPTVFATSPSRVPHLFCVSQKET